MHHVLQSMQVTQQRQLYFQGHWVLCSLPIVSHVRQRFTVGSGKAKRSRRSKLLRRCYVTALHRWCYASNYKIKPLSSRPRRNRDGSGITLGLVSIGHRKCVHQPPPPRPCCRHQPNGEGGRRCVGGLCPGRRQVGTWLKFCTSLDSLV